MSVNKPLKRTFSAPFDPIAGSYDTLFTHTPLGRRKRRLVHHYLSEIVQKDWNVLELNCGTGEDALWMSQHVNHIVATDMSIAMLEQGKEKVQRENVSNVDFSQMRLEKLWEGVPTTITSKVPDGFDLIFSNFDGLNCLKNLSPLPTALYSLLVPHGEVVLVLMSKVCLVERVAWLLRGQLGKAFARRNKEGIRVHIGEGRSMTTYFHATSTILQLFKKAGYRVENVRAIGLTTPPTSMRDFYERHIGNFQRFEPVEDWLSKYYPFNRMGDHILIHVKRID